MINTKELRIGNLISFPHEKYQKYQLKKGVYPAGAISPSAIEILTPDGSWMGRHENYEPVPITVEWLEKLGFTFAVPSGYALPFWCVEISSETVLIWRDKEFLLSRYALDVYSDDIPVPIRIQYVHQLQNLFFSLTGEELTLKDQ